jgi:hypothetical protein
MKEIYSKNEPSLLAHVIVGIDDFNDRIDLGDTGHFLQVAILKVNAGKEFRPHIHIPKNLDMNGTWAQEAWVVIKGLVHVDYYDIGGAYLASHGLKAGDCSVTFYGGHGFKVTKDSWIYEFKSGPYLGVKKDKIFIENMKV